MRLTLDKLLSALKQVPADADISLMTANEHGGVILEFWKPEFTFDPSIDYTLLENHHLLTDKSCGFIVLDTETREVGNFDTHYEHIAGQKEGEEIAEGEFTEVEEAPDGLAR